MSGNGSIHPLVAKVSLLATAIIGSGFAEPALSIPVSHSVLQPVPQVMQIGGSRSVQETEDSVNGLAIIGIALASSAAIGLGLSAIVERKRPNKLIWSTSTGKTLPQSASTGFDQVSAGLQRKLLRLLHEDRGAAHRLFVHTRLKHPGKSPNWYAEKIIYDLERDRGKY